MLVDKYPWFHSGNDKMVYFWNPPSTNALAVATMVVSI